MADEAAIGPVGAPDCPRHSRGGASQQSAVQSRSQFLKDRSWKLVTRLNVGTCTRGGPERGFIEETQTACAREGAQTQEEVWPLDETIESLRWCHRRSLFLLLDGNITRLCGTALSDGCLPSDVQKHELLVARFADKSHGTVGEKGHQLVVGNEFYRTGASVSAGGRTGDLGHRDNRLAAGQMGRQPRP